MQNNWPTISKASGTSWFSGFHLSLECVQNPPNLKLTGTVGQKANAAPTLQIHLDSVHFPNIIIGQCRGWGLLSVFKSPRFQKVGSKLADETSA